MKLNYRDRVLLMVALVIIILVAGIFALIKPKAEEISSNQKKLEQKEKEWAELEAEIAQIPDIQARITEKHGEAVELAEYFLEYEVIDNSYELEQFLQPYLDKDGLDVNVSMNITEPKAEVLNYYYYTPNVVTYSIYEHADFDGSLALEMEKKLEESLDLSARTSQQVAASTVTFTCKGSKDELKAFLKDIKDLDTTINVTAVQIGDYTFNEDMTPEEEAHSTIEKGDASMTVTVYFYSAQVATAVNLD